MNARDPPGSLIDWEEDYVVTWMSNIGFSQYESHIREHNVSGDVLAALGQEDLKEIGIETIGQRLAILKAVYYLKLAHGVPIEPDHYVPPSEADDEQDGVSLESLHEIVRDQAERLRQLEYDNRCLQSDLQTCLDELGNNVRHSAQQARVQKPATRPESFQWTPPNFTSKAQRSPTRAAVESDIDSPKASPLAPEHDISPTNSSSNIVSPPQSTPSTARPSQSTEGLKDSLKDGLKSFKVSLDDPAWKVLPAALKKYKINNDDWQNYAMFICYGNTERCLSYDEKPLLLFQKLKDANKNPVFMLKHIRDIRSPIVVAQQKQAQRQQVKQSEAAALHAASTPTSANTNSRTAGIAENPRVAALSRQQSGRQRSGSASQARSNGNMSANGNGSWPTGDVMSPSVDSRGDDTPNGDTRVGAGNGTPAPKDVSYAVAIYPYLAEQDDEFTVAVSDTFIILQRGPGWWVVQRDPLGDGQVDIDPAKQGWVPAGCLLETSVPVASAVAEATGGNMDADGKPILPLSIISTSFPGIALMDYSKKGEAELDLKKDDLVRVFKRYNHWSYAVKEEGGQRGWVPSWFIGKAGVSNQQPHTQAANHAAHSGNLSASSMLEPSDIRYAAADAEGIINGSSASPVSPGFPR
ncbi:hypothetical protein M422DRAFT_151475 [Sphaerobolus stellatus SS14]|nr:hypothetical protein M422DRAFT_151475 [Sphaerobolus stellatus SS14]